MAEKPPLVVDLFRGPTDPLVRLLWHRARLIAAGESGERDRAISEFSGIAGTVGPLAGDRVH